MYPRKQLLIEALANLEQVISWHKFHSFNNVIQYAAQANILIELLEVQDCGSTDGYDSKNPLVRVSSYKLVNRFVTLVQKRSVLTRNELKRMQDIINYFKDSPQVLGETRR